MIPQPYYILFAGVNGAGKSTFYQTGLWRHGGNDAPLPRINPDEILAANGWDWRNDSDQIKAGKIAVRAIQQHLAHNESFNQETTLTGKSILKNIAIAREKGYRIVMFYICVNDPAIAHSRISHRSEIGGHSIEPAIVTVRYDKSLDNLVECIGLCDEVYLYDNTMRLELEARFAFGELAYFNPSEPHLSWIARTTRALGYREIDWQNVAGIMPRSTS